MGVSFLEKCFPAPQGLKRAPAGGTRFTAIAIGLLLLALTLTAYFG